MQLEADWQVDNCMEWEALWRHKCICAVIKAMRMHWHVVGSHLIFSMDPVGPAPLGAFDFSSLSFFAASLNSSLHGMKDCGQS